MKYFAIGLVIIISVILGAIYYVPKIVDGLNNCFSGICSSKVSQLNTKIHELEERTSKDHALLEKVFSTKVKGKPVYSLPVTATGYSAREEECDGTPEYTASMTPSRVGVIAVSKDLEDEIGLKMGQMVLIEGMGTFRIEDRMNKRWKRRIDIMHGNQKAALLFGKKDVKITWIGRG
jgi:3D (Asp-Asp-Asp) domain-containing protein